MSESSRVPSRAYLLHCFRCRRAFVEMLALIDHRCAADPQTPPKRRPRARRPKALGGGGEMTR